MHPLRDHGGVGISHPQTRGAEVGDQKREQRLQTRCPFKRPPSGNRGHSWRWGGVQNFTLFSTTGVGPTPNCFHKTWPNNRAPIFP